MDVRIDEHGKYFTQRINKETVAAVVRTTDYIIVGQVYVRPDYRLKDELNAEAGRFLAVTEARVYDTGSERLLFESDFLLLSYHHIIMISPLEAVRNVAHAAWEPQAPEETA